MPVDPNIILQSKTSPINPMELMGQVANLQNARNQNALFQAKAIAGQYLEQSMGPDGRPDVGKLNNLLMGDRRTAPYGPDILHSAFEQQGQAIGNQTNQLGLQSSKIANLGNVIASADATIPKDDPNRQAKIAARVKAGEDAGLYDHDTSSGWAGGQSFNGVQDFGSLGMQAGAMQAGPKAAELGETALTSVPGGGQKAITTNQVQQSANFAGGSASNLAPAQGPEAMGALVSYQAPDGSTRQIAKSAIQNKDGTMIANARDGDGNAVTDPNGALKVTLGMNDVAQLAANSKNQADRAATLATAVEGSAARKAIIQEMLATQGDFRSGPGASKWSGIIAEANRVLGTNFENTPASAQQVFGKLAEQLSATQRETLGIPATNAGQEAAHLASPNTAYSPEANRQVLAQLAGNEDLLQTKQAAWDKYQAAAKQHGKTATYNGFISQFNKTFDPRSAWEPYMTEQQKAAMYKSMSDPDRQAYSAKSAKAQSLMKLLQGAQ